MGFGKQVACAVADFMVADTDRAVIAQPAVVPVAVVLAARLGEHTPITVRLCLCDNAHFVVLFPGFHLNPIRSLVRAIPTPCIRAVAASVQT